MAIFYKYAELFQEASGIEKFNTNQAVKDRKEHDKDKNAVNDDVYQRLYDSFVAEIHNSGLKRAEQEPFLRALDKGKKLTDIKMARTKSVHNGQNAVNELKNKIEKLRAKLESEKAAKQPKNK